MKPFKDVYKQRCVVWMRANAGSRITDYDIAGLVNEALIKVASNLFKEICKNKNITFFANHII